MAYVNFWKGLAAEYVAETHQNGIYQCTDTGDTYIFGVLNSGDGVFVIESSRLNEAKTTDNGLYDDIMTAINAGKPLFIKSGFECTSISMPGKQADDITGEMISNPSSYVINSYYQDPDYLCLRASTVGLSTIALGNPEPANDLSISEIGIFFSNTTKLVVNISKMDRPIPREGDGTKFLSDDGSYKIPKYSQGIQFLDVTPEAWSMKADIFSIYKPDNGGRKVLALISDITNLIQGTSENSYGIEGLFYVNRSDKSSVNIRPIHRTGFISCWIGYKVNQFRLQTTDADHVISEIVNYNGRTYLGLKLSGSSLTLNVLGHIMNILDELIYINYSEEDDPNGLPAGVTRYNKSMKPSDYSMNVQVIGLDSQNQTLGYKKIQEVASLPASPDANTLYVIPEE